MLSAKYPEVVSKTCNPALQDSQTAHAEAELDFFPIFP